MRGSGCEPIPREARGRGPDPSGLLPVPAKSLLRLILGACAWRSPFPAGRGRGGKGENPRPRAPRARPRKRDFWGAPRGACPPGPPEAAPARSFAGCPERSDGHSGDAEAFRDADGSGGGPRDRCPCCEAARAADKAGQSARRSLCALSRSGAASVPAKRSGAVRERKEVIPCITCIS